MYRTPPKIMKRTIFITFQIYDRAELAITDSRSIIYNKAASTHSLFTVFIIYHL